MTEQFKDLYKGNSEEHTPEALNLAYRVREMVEPLIKEHQEQGFRLREIEGVIISEVNMVVLEKLLNKRYGE